MRFIYNSRKNQMICEYEDKMLNICSEIIEGYKVSFAEYGCTLKIERIWHDFFRNRSVYQRLDFQNGYGCYIYCRVERNGEVVRYEDEEREVDYYELSDCWAVSSIMRKGFKLSVCLFTDLGVVRETLDNYLLILKKLS